MHMNIYHQLQFNIKKKPTSCNTYRLCVLKLRETTVVSFNFYNKKLLMSFITLKSNVNSCSVSLVYLVNFFIL